MSGFGFADRRSWSLKKRKVRVLEESRHDGRVCLRERSTYKPGVIRWTFPRRWVEGARSDERIRVKLADHEMQGEKYQIIIHPNPLFGVLDQERRDLEVDTHESQRCNSDNARNLLVRSGRGRHGVGAYVVTSPLCTV